MIGEEEVGYACPSQGRVRFVRGHIELSMIKQLKGGVVMSCHTFAVGRQEVFDSLMKYCKSKSQLVRG